MDQSFPFFYVFPKFVPADDCNIKLIFGLNHGFEQKDHQAVSGFSFNARRSALSALAPETELKQRRFSAVGGEWKIMRKTKEASVKTRSEIIAAARMVFHRDGVMRSSLEKIAKEAGVTRGAIYWHFESKAELFKAVREELLLAMLEPMNQILFSESINNPLDAIESAMKEFFQTLLETASLRDLLEIMMIRCEYVDEFDGLELDVGKQAKEFLEKIKVLYRDAGGMGILRFGFDPDLMALDTWSFSTGLLYIVIRGQLSGPHFSEVFAMISHHMALRRC